MRLQTRFRLNTGVSLGATLVLALVMGWSVRDLRRASDAEGLLSLLQRHVLERGIVRDEYLQYRERRAEVQWLSKSDQIDALLQRATSSFHDREEHESLRQMGSLVGRSRTMFGDIVRMDAAAGESEGSRAASAAFRERATTSLLLASHELYGRASRLADLASQRFSSTLRTMLALIVVMMSSVVVITIFNATMISKLLAQRITRLRDGAERVAAGSLDHRIGFAGNDELAVLGQSFDAMTARLQQVHSSLEGEVAERRDAEAQVVRLNEELNGQVAKLAASNGELEAFSYSVSHDLRAPLRSIAGFSQAVLEDYGPKLDEPGRQYLDMACQASREMGQLIDDLLSLSRVTRVELAHEQVDLTTIARSVAEDLRRAEPGRTVEIEIAPALVAEGDPTLLRMVLDNLLRNAWKFTSTHSTARIVFGRDRSHGRDAFRVSDDGVGFDMAYAEKLLRPFQRLHGSHEFPGTGIGLATVNRIVRRHGGEVWLHGEVEKGAAISFTLPTRGAVVAGPHGGQEVSLR